MELDFRSDHQCWDNVCAIRYEVARGNGSIADLPPLFDGRTPAPVPPRSRNKPLFIGTAKRRQLTQRELAASGGVYTGMDNVWLVPDVLFPAGFVSKPGDVVVELADGSAEQQPGTRWTCLDWAWGKNRQTRRLTCRDLVLSFDLRDSITIERPALSYDESGVPVKAFPSDAVNSGGVVLYANLPARAQLVTKQEAEQRGIRGLAGKYRVYVSMETDVTAEDRILLDNGMYLDVVGYENAMRIDELPAIIAERRI